MFMLMLKKNAPILAFVLVLLLCGFYGYLSYVDPKSDPSVRDAEKNQKTVVTKLNEGNVTPEYTYSSDNAQKLKYVDTLKTNSVERIKTASDGNIGINASYPQPVRPKSEGPEVKPDATPKKGVAPGLKDGKDDFEATADRGKVYVKCELPAAAEFAYTEPVRIEIFRGLAKDKIDLSKPIGTIELGLEDPPAKPAGLVEPPKPVAPAEVKSTRAQGGQPAADKKAEVKLPATTRVYRDQNDIKQKTEYFYQARLIVRFAGVDGKIEAVKEADGRNLLYVYQAPNQPGVTPVPASSPTSTSKLYATALTGVKSATTPTNFELRLSGINGKMPDPNAPRPPAAHDNKTFSVNFELRAWIPDLGDWKTVQLAEKQEGDVLGGKITYSKKGDPEKKEYDFTADLGYKIYEVNMEEVDSTVAVGQKELKEVAILENLKTKAKERFIKMSAPPKRKEKLNEFDKIIDAQDKEIETIKKAAAAAAAAAPATAPAPATPTTPTK